MIYYLEDDKNIRDLVIYTLNKSNLDARGFQNSEEFFAALDQALPQLVLLDIMLPGEDGLSILKKLRSNTKTADLPIIMVTSKGTEYDKVMGLDMGADDYLPKPFGMMELVARINARLRRVPDTKDSADISAGALRVNPRQYMVWVNDVPVTLTHKEFELLYFLLDNKGIVFSRDSLLEAVWGYDYLGGTRTVDVHIQTLRQKLGECGRYIETVRSVGYRFGGPANDEKDL
ncbi:MAG: response regulator transcription factor [Christensenellales bacterium]